MKSILKERKTEIEANLKWFSRCYNYVESVLGANLNRLSIKVKDLGDLYIWYDVVTSDVYATIDVDKGEMVICL